MGKHNISLYREVSAKTGNQVLDAFKALGEKLMSKGINNKEEGNKRISLSDSKNSNREGRDRDRDNR